MTRIKLDSLTTRIFIGFLCVKLVKSAKFVKLVKPDKHGLHSSLTTAVWDARNDLVPISNILD
jgi:hypothetical protein